MRLLIVLIALLPLYAYADSPPKETGRNFNNALEVPSVIPNDRCIWAVFGPELRKERGFRMESWKPPISDRTLRWFYVKRAEGKLKLVFCDEAKI
jgi:hypothetical protein